MKNQTEKFKNLIDSLCSKDPDLETEAALTLNNSNLTHEDLIYFIELNKANLRLFALLKISKVKNQKEADLLVSCLTNNENEVRAAASFKLKEFLENKDLNHFFNNEKYFETYIKCATDVNPKVCRNISASVKYLNNRFQLVEKFSKIILETLIEYDNYKPYRSHKLNRILFSIFWCMDTLVNLLYSIDEDCNNFIEDLVAILIKTSKFREYTIREKAAQLVLVLRKFNHSKETESALNQIDDTMSNDENFYVRAVLRSNE